MTDIKKVQEDLQGILHEMKRSIESGGIEDTELLFYDLCKLKTMIDNVARAN